MICHNRDAAWAAQAFYDLNNLAVRPSPGLAITRDRRTPINNICRNIEDKVKWLSGRVSMRVAALKKDDPELVTFLNLRTFVATLALGPTAVKYGSKPVPIDAKLESKVERVAIAFLNALHDAFPAACSDRETLLLLNPTIFGALGGLATDLVRLENGQLG